MTRLLMFGLSLALCFSLVGCGDSGQTEVLPRGNPTADNSADIDAEKDKQAGGYDGTYESVPGEEDLHKTVD